MARKTKATKPNVAVFEDLGEVADSLSTTAEHLQDYVGNNGLVSPRAFGSLSKYAVRLEIAVNKAISNKGGAPAASLPPRTDLPPIAKDIPKVPPENQPVYDPTKSETDFQLQQALAVVRAMPVSTHAAK